MRGHVSALIAFAALACSSSPSEPAPYAAPEAGAGGSAALGTGGQADTGVAGLPDGRAAGGSAPSPRDSAPSTEADAPAAKPRQVFAVFEQDFAAPGSGYANPWEDVTVTMTVTSPSGKKTTVGGFYHSGTTYKARFRPDEPGTWTFSATVADSKASTPSSGTFQAKSDTGHGFIRQSTDNPNRWKWEDGTPYYGLGLQSGMPNAGALDTPGGTMGGLYLGEGQPVGLDAFLRTTASSGMNMFRWTIDNNSPGLWETIAASGNIYKEQEGIDGDRIVADARKYGFAILFTFFNYWGQHAAFWGQQTLTSGETGAMQRYAQYLIDRYGASIDIWDVVNEGNATAAWYAALIPYLQAHDPYHHDVTSSTVYALDQTAWDAGVTLNMMHWYAPITEDHADQWTYDNIVAWKAAGPVSNTIVGETGNCCSVCNYGPTGFRLRNWAAFFAEAILIYWDDATTKSACGGANTNYYIGDEERAFAKVLQDFNKDFDSKAAITDSFAIQGAGVKGHGLSGPSDYALYLVAQNHTVETSGVKVTVTPQSAGHATWIDPSTGSVLGELDALSGTQTLDVPAFTTDIALKIRGQ